MRIGLLQKFLLGVVLMIIGTVGQKFTSSGTSAGYPRNKVVLFKSGDPEMEAARAKARATLATFWTAHASPARGERAFSLKVAISDGKQIEHFWLNEIKRSGTRIVGRIDNKPSMVANVTEGQRYEFAEAEINDWMFQRNGKIVGNETMRPLLKKMPPAEAARYSALLENP